MLHRRRVNVRICFTVVISYYTSSKVPKCLSFFDFFFFKYLYRICYDLTLMFECVIHDEFKLVVVVDGGASVRDCMQNYCWKCMNSHHRGAREWQHLTEATLMLEWATKHEVRVPWSDNLGTILWCWFLRVFRHRCKILKTK